MAKLSRNDKIKIYKEYKNGKSIMNLTKNHSKIILFN